ncbi:hypothetical protein [Candidatus Nitrosocosmicus sp. FF01]|uniref:hypothetical protein n=1 Tax=Candidatus Nitrosocosmicus sp. FF01 TaxID=3397670 RepID=UPI0039EC710A
MSTLLSTENELVNNLHQDTTCDRFGCYNLPSEKFNVSAGTFGTITLNLCSKCVKVFQEGNSSSNRSVL